MACIMNIHIHSNARAQQILDSSSNEHKLVTQHLVEAACFLLFIAVNLLGICKW